MPSPSEERLHNRVLDERDARIRELEAEVKIKDEIHRMDEIAYSEMEAELTAANARITALEQQLGDWHDDAARVLNEDCPPDEAHCTCVPHLRDRVKALEAEVICQNKLKSRVMELEAEVAYREESKVNQLLVTDLPVKALDRIRSLVAQQAEDLALWYTNPRTAPEVYLQQELRKLHALIEEVLG